MIGGGYVAIKVIRYYKLFILSCLFRTNSDFTNFLKVEIGEMLVKD